MIISNLPSLKICHRCPAKRPCCYVIIALFIAFWLARVFTASGFQMLTVAIGWNLYQLTGNVLDLGLVGLVEFAPRVLFMLHTGHVADRYDRRKVAAICQSLQALIALTLAIGGATGHVTREMIFILAFLLGAARPSRCRPPRRYCRASFLLRCSPAPSPLHSRRNNRQPSLPRPWVVCCMPSAASGSTGRP